MTNKGWKLTDEGWIQEKVIAEVDENTAVVAELPQGLDEKAALVAKCKSLGFKTANVNWKIETLKAKIAEAE